jgi:hypothetical protein
MGADQARGQKSITKSSPPTGRVVLVVANLFCRGISRVFLNRNLNLFPFASQNGPREIKIKIKSKNRESDAL